MGLRVWAKSFDHLVSSRKKSRMPWKILSVLACCIQVVWKTKPVKQGCRYPSKKKAKINQSEEKRIEQSSCSIEAIRNWLPTDSNSLHNHECRSSFCVEWKPVVNFSLSLSAVRCQQHKADQAFWFFANQRATISSGKNCLIIRCEKHYSNAFIWCCYFFFFLWLCTVVSSATWSYERKSAMLCFSDVSQTVVLYSTDSDASIRGVRISSSLVYLNCIIEVVDW